MKLPVSQLVLNPDNPRVIKDDKYRKLVQSLKDFPEMADIREIVVNKDNVILGGNMRFRAMQEAGWTEVPVKVVDWSEEKQREFIIKDNSSFGEWDYDVLANQYELEDLEAWGVDLPYDLKNTEVEEDEPPEVEGGAAKSVLGTVYQLGRHRVMCGDSTVKENVELLMDGVKADMVFTDPPYGVSYEGRKKFGIIDNDELDKVGLLDFLRLAFGNVSDVLKEGGCFYICSGWPTIKEFITATEDKRLKLSTKLVWIKNNLGWGFADYRTKTEVILYGFKEGGKHYWCGDRDQSNVWEFSKDTDYKHPTQKPIELVAKAINNSSKNGESIVDLFLGSGSTLIACEQTDRICYGMELDPKYVDVIRKRYWKFTHDGNEEGWEEGTPAINAGEKQVVENAVS